MTPDMVIFNLKRMTDAATHESRVRRIGQPPLPYAVAVEEPVQFFFCALPGWRWPDVKGAS